jgi:SAM-dependent methyltransferase
VRDDLWERHAGWWQDEFTDGADPEYVEQIVPLCVQHLAGATRVLDLGAGEGQVSRAVRAAGGRSVQVVAVDPTAAQVAEAVRRAGAVDVVRGDGTALPFASGSFDAVVACLVFEHVDDMDGAIGEVARVLTPGGRFVLLLNHPLLQTPGSGWIDDHLLDPPEQYWRVGDYLTEAESVEEVSKGIWVRFLHRPLHRYVNTMAERGLLVRRMVEPAPPDGFLARSLDYAAARHIPRLLLLEAVKGPTGGAEQLTAR